MGLQDEFKALKAISIEELQEQADEVDYLTPREFAKLIGVHPQQVYTWIRKGVFPSEPCKCGRTVIKVSLAKQALDKKARELGRYIRPEDDPKLARRRTDVQVPSEQGQETSMAQEESLPGEGMDSISFT